MLFEQKATVGKLSLANDGIRRNPLDEYGIHYLAMDGTFLRGSSGKISLHAHGERCFISSLWCLRGPFSALGVQQPRCNSRSEEGEVV